MTDWLKDLEDEDYLRTTRVRKVFPRKRTLYSVSASETGRAEAKELRRYYEGIEVNRRIREQAQAAVERGDVARAEQRRREAIELNLSMLDHPAKGTKRV